LFKGIIANCSQCDGGSSYCQKCANNMFLNTTNASCLISCSSDDMKYYANTSDYDNFTCALCNLSIK